MIPGVGWEIPAEQAIAERTGRIFGRLEGASRFRSRGHQGRSRAIVEGSCTIELAAPKCFPGPYPNWLWPPFPTVVNDYADSLRVIHQLGVRMWMARIDVVSEIRLAYQRQIPIF